MLRINKLNFSSGLNLIPPYYIFDSRLTVKLRGKYAFLRQNKYVGVQLILDPIFAHLPWPHPDADNFFPTLLKSVFSAWKYHGNLNSGLYGYLYDDLDHENKAIKIGFLK